MSTVKLTLLRMLKTVLLIQRRSAKRQMRPPREPVRTEARAVDMQAARPERVVLMLQRQRRAAKIGLLPQPRQLPTNKPTIPIKSTTRITVRDQLSLLIANPDNNASHASLDYDQAGQGAPWYSDKHNKRKKKLEGPLGVDPNAEIEDATGNQSCSSPLTAPGLPLLVTLDTPGANQSHESAMKRDVHSFIFDDEAVVVDDCSFVLPYIEGAYYYQSTTPPPATDNPLTNTDVNADDFTAPLVPAYTEQQLKELLRRQV